ncbi:cell wall-associated NlpC family hydrolase [Hymenobacter luteus]|uniref:Cell wall-associated NlpC family hydrolase n=2 Tax=Hymenobacter TaxID=89966 RepID=A0A7W9WCF9_9BACT|nr:MULTISPECIES: C40 family peptidase [Hymenobacter]MBB4602121.1 cell wall-associated NlpC family hydrolase [Hymenobacter latericoloratus]MBB6059450.1 cell wall-associated NlpC family hydrolase [Hymenobacter luteus]
MRYVWLAFLLLVGLVAGVAFWPRRAPQSVARLRPRVVAPVHATAYLISHQPTPRADSIVAFALRQLGTNYCYAGTTPETGFDCSGFVNYVFARYRVPVPHSTALLISTGRAVERTQARPGDIVVFTGTAATSTTPGHAGIVISKPGERPLRFVHSSSARRESGVKISQVEGTDYERRFMQVRRVL